MDVEIAFSRFLLQSAFIPVKICFIGHIIVRPNICRSYDFFSFSLTRARSAELAIVTTHHLSVPSVRPSDVRPSVRIFLVYILISTNMYQSVPNLARMYLTIRSRISLIMDVNRQEMPQLSALELENLTYLTLFTF